MSLGAQTQLDTQPQCPPSSSSEEDAGLRLAEHTPSPSAWCVLEFFNDSPLAHAPAPQAHGSSPPHDAPATATSVAGSSGSVTVCGRRFVDIEPRVSSSNSAQTTHSFTLGRRSNNSAKGEAAPDELLLCLGHPRVSSRHCRAYCRPSLLNPNRLEVILEDISSNGTFLYVHGHGAGSLSSPSAAAAGAAGRGTTAVLSHTRIPRHTTVLLRDGDEFALVSPTHVTALEEEAAAEQAKVAKARVRVMEARERVHGASSESASAAGGSREAEAELAAAATALAAAEASAAAAAELRWGVTGVRVRLIASRLRANQASGSAAGAASLLRASTVMRLLDQERRIDDVYDLRECLGRGTCGEVYRAVDRRNGKHVAIKKIDASRFLLAPNMPVNELLQEAELLRAMRHPFIIGMEDVFADASNLYLVMELVTGGDLFDRIVTRQRYSEDTARRLMRRLLLALSYLHARDVVHRDLKPENILLATHEDDITVKVTDFGLAKRASEGLKTFCGTPQYFAPEVLQRSSTVDGSGRYGKPADIWSVGVILYILLSGTPPFAEATLYDQIENGRYTLSDRFFSTTAAALVRRMICVNPDERITAAAALDHPWLQENASGDAEFIGMRRNQEQQLAELTRAGTISATAAVAARLAASAAASAASSSSAAAAAAAEEAAPGKRSNPSGASSPAADDAGRRQRRRGEDDDGDHV